MSRMTTLAQRRDKVGRFAPKWSIRVGGKPLSRTGMQGDKVESWRVVYDADGTSEAVLSSSLDLARYANAPVDISFGYDDEIEHYFAGKLSAPNDSWYGESSEHTAWGPYKLMQEQKFLQQVSYNNVDIQDALFDIVKRAGYRTGLVDIHPGRSFLIEGDSSTFTLQSNLKDAADTLCASANWIFVDRPGGVRLATPKPRAGATTRAKAVYAEDQYPFRAFKATISTKNIYSRVIIFRRNADGNLDFPPVDFPVAVESLYKPSRLNAYILENFVGGYRDAVREARATAELLQNGMYACSLSGIDANPDLLLHDTLETFAIEPKDTGGRTPDSYKSLYRWQVDGQTVLSVSREGANMDLTGSGVQVWTRLLPKPFYPGDRRKNPYAVLTPPAPGTSLLGSTVPGSDLVPDTQLMPTK